MALGFDDIKFKDKKLHKDKESTGTIHGAEIKKGHFLLVSKGKKKTWFGWTTAVAGGDGRLPFSIWPLFYEDDGLKPPFGEDTVTVTVINPGPPPESSGPNDAVPQPDIP